MADGGVYARSNGKWERVGSGGAGGGLDVDATREDAVLQVKDTDGVKSWVEGMALQVVEAVPDDTVGEIGDVVFIPGGPGGSPVGPAPGLELIDDASFTSVSTISFSGCFSANYKRYKLVFYSSDSGSTRIRLRSGASDDSTSNYDNAGRITGTNNADVNDAADDSWRGLDQANTSINVVNMDILNPFDATETVMTGFAWQSTPGTNYYAHAFAGQHRSASSFDGVSVILGGAGTFTGTAAIYGYKD